MRFLKEVELFKGTHTHVHNWEFKKKKERFVF